MRTVFMAALALLVVGFADPSHAVEISSKAKKITITGRAQTQWSHSSVEGELSNEFLIRRARLAAKLEINDWVSGTVEPDFGGGGISLKNAYLQMKPTDNFVVQIGQTKRRFDLFELTSSTQILVIERDGRIGRTKVPSLSRFTEGLGYSDFDIGVFVMVQDGNERIRVDAAVTNGSGANTKAVIGEKAFQGRLSVTPAEDMPLSLHGGVSLRPFQSGADPDSVEYAPAFEASAEWGDFESGPHVQAGFVTGDDWTGYSPTDNKSPTFIAIQGILTYKHALESNEWFEAVEPLVRVGFADPNTDMDDDGGVLVTPGLNVFLAHRNRLSVNADIFIPQASGAETEFGVKAQSWLYF